MRQISVARQIAEKAISSQTQSMFLLLFLLLVCILIRSSFFVLVLIVFHKQVLIFSQWTKILDIMHYYLEESGFEVCRIDGSVKLEERRKQVTSAIRFL